MICSWSLTVWPSRRAEMNEMSRYCFDGLRSKMDRTSSDRTSTCNHMLPIYWSTGGNFLAAPENKHINIMNIRG